MKTEINPTPILPPPSEYVLRLSREEARLFVHLVGCRHTDTCELAPEVEEFAKALQKQIIGEWPV